MFKATFKKYWCDYKFEIETISRGTMDGILEYAYSFYKNGCYPAWQKFLCRGGRSSLKGYLEASCCLMERGGYRGSVWLEKIIYTRCGEPDVIIFEKNKYISPKASKAFDDFAEKVKREEEAVKYGDY